MTAAQLQHGIYYDAKATPHPAYRLVLLNAPARAPREAVGRSLARLMEMFELLSEGRVPELRGQPNAERAASAGLFEGLHALIGYGRRLFDNEKHRPRLTFAERPDFLSYLRQDGPFPRLRWAPAQRQAEADFAVQLTAASEAGVACAAVEAWKLIADEQLALTLVESFSGFGRADRRGWLGFHDGVSNMPSELRLRALVASADPPWMEGGTYMAYLRLLVDLAKWRALNRDHQELMVGRGKLTGAAIIRVNEEGERLRPVAGRAPGRDAGPTELAHWRDPPQTSNPVLEASHIARANQSRASPFAPGAFRMFRQGYDFLESLTEGDLQLGLNFVSFQRDLRVLQQLLHLPEWLGDTNFGGTAEGKGDAPLISVAAGGFYAVPARAKPYAGAGLFDTDR